MMTAATKIEAEVDEGVKEIDQTKISLGEFELNKRGQMSKDDWGWKRDLQDICNRLEGKKAGLMEAWELIKAEEKLRAVV